MRLFPGQTAKDFSVQDMYGNPLKLSELKGQKILLSFFRNASCPFCNMRVHRLTQKKKQYDALGLKMVFVFETDPKYMLKSTFHQGVSPIPLIGDPEKELYHLYGVENNLLKAFSTFLSSSSRRLLAQSQKDIEQPGTKEVGKSSLGLLPADFLITEDFKIRTAHYGRKLDDHVTFEQLENFASRNAAA